MMTKANKTRAAKTPCTAQQIQKMVSEHGGHMLRPWHEGFQIAAQTSPRTGPSLNGTSGSLALGPLPGASHSHFSFPQRFSCQREFEAQNPYGLAKCTMTSVAYTQRTGSESEP